MLLEAVKSLSLEGDRAEDFEILVIDNGGKDRPDEAVAALKLSIPCRVLREETVGLSAARNRGWKEAQGRVIAYLDDDALASKDWLVVAKEIIEARNPICFGGPYGPFYTTKRPSWFRDAYASHCPAQEARPLDEGEFLTGGNLFLRREVLEAVGGFSPDLGMKGSGLGYAEETALQLRIRKQWPMEEIYFDPRLRITHWVRPEKMKLCWKLRQRFVDGRFGRRVFGEALEGAGGKASASFRFFLRVLAFLGSVSFGAVLRSRQDYPYVRQYIYERSFRHVFAMGALWTRLMEGR